MYVILYFYLLLFTICPQAIIRCFPSRSVYLKLCSLQGATCRMWDSPCYTHIFPLEGHRMHACVSTYIANEVQSTKYMISSIVLYTWSLRTHKGYIVRSPPLPLIHLRYSATKQTLLEKNIEDSSSSEIPNLVPQRYLNFAINSGVKLSVRW